MAPDTNGAQVLLDYWLKNIQCSGALFIICVMQSRAEMEESRHNRVCLEISVKQDELEGSLTEGPFNEILTDRRKVGKSWPGIVYFSTEPEKFWPISDV